MQGLLFNGLSVVYHHGCVFLLHLPHFTKHMNHQSAIVQTDSAIEALLSRRSVKAVVSPGPSVEQINTILKAATHAPDHNALRVWRFVLIDQSRMPAFTELAMNVMKASKKGIDPDKERRNRDWLSKVPLLIGLAYKIHHDNSKVPEIEQTLSMGAAVMNMQNIIHLMGYASFWSTGLGSHGEEVPAALGFDTLDYRFVGFLAVGTPAGTPGLVQRPDPMSLAHVWSPD